MKSPYKDYIHDPTFRHSGLVSLSGVISEFSVTRSGNFFYQIRLNALKHQLHASNNFNTKNRRECPTKNKQFWSKNCIYGHRESDVENHGLIYCQGDVIYQQDVNILVASNVRAVTFLFKARGLALICQASKQSC